VRTRAVGLISCISSQVKMIIKRAALRDHEMQSWFFGTCSSINEERRIEKNHLQRS